jgi:hypothetical protein
VRVGYPSESNLKAWPFCLHTTDFRKRITGAAGPRLLHKAEKRLKRAEKLVERFRRGLISMESMNKQ